MFELECRYYFSEKELDKILKKLKSFDDLIFKGKYYEETSQYDVADSKYSFYNKEIDGRFRVRLSKSSFEEKLLLSWKRRLKGEKGKNIHKEEEIELHLIPKEYDNLLSILEGVLKMKKVESYERNRYIFSNNDIEIVVDKFPFGIALEIESLDKSEETILNWTKKLNLDINESYKYSWDDKYAELCNQQGIEIFKNVKFGLKMPHVEETFYE